MKQRILAIALVIATSAAWANCEPSQRIALDDAECLSGTWENRTWPKKDTAYAFSKCSDLGTVVAKVDRAHASDWTFWIEDSNPVSKSGEGNALTYIRGIFCCSDLGDLCNKVDILNEDACAERFESSPAVQNTEGNLGSMGCDLVQTEIDDEYCSVTASCHRQVQQSPTRTDLLSEWTQTLTTTCHIADVEDMTFYEGGGTLGCN